VLQSNAFKNFLGLGLSAKRCPNLKESCGAKRRNSLLGLDRHNRI